MILLFATLVGCETSLLGDGRKISNAQLTASSKKSDRFAAWKARFLQHNSNRHK